MQPDLIDYVERKEIVAAWLKKNRKRHWYGFPAIAPERLRPLLALHILETNGILGNDTMRSTSDEMKFRGDPILFTNWPRWLAFKYKVSMSFNSARAGLSRVWQIWGL